MDEDLAKGDAVIRDGDVVIKGLTPYLTVGDVGVRQEPHQAFQPRTVPRERRQLLVMETGLSVFRDGEPFGSGGGPRLEDVLESLRARIYAEESMLPKGQWGRLVEG